MHGNLVTFAGNILRRGERVGNKQFASPRTTRRIVRIQVSDEAVRTAEASLSGALWAVEWGHSGKSPPSCLAVLRVACS